MQYGALLAEGKTKQIYAHPSDLALAIMQHKDAITAGDGARRDTIPGKALLSGPTTANVFALLARQGIATHYVAAPTADTMVVQRCTMIPIEIVTRRRATGSYLKRHPEVVEGQRFDPLVVEFFFKDDANHDPLMTVAELNAAGIASTERCAALGRIARRVFLAIEQAFAAQTITLVDLKIECGLTSVGQLVVADVIDNDSWRIWPEGNKELMLDKQVYRNMQSVTPEGLARIAALYQTAKELTDAWT
jgi:phosphoribosylaminoimidazole-succinocarboxamide synthase